MATIEQMKQALVNAHKAGDTAAATKLAAAIVNAEKVTPRSEKQVMDEYNNMPWYSKAGTAADDLVRLGASGISFGGLDRLLGPEQAKLTEEARIRAGWAGTGAEIGGSIASPITRAVGAVGSGLTKVAPGLLARMGIAGGEGAVLGATEAAIKGKDVKDGATTGAIISGMIPGLGAALGRTSSFFQGTDPKSLTTAFKSGMEGGSVGKAFRQAQAGKHITDAKNEFANAERGWSRGSVRVVPLMDEATKITREVTTDRGVPKLTPADMNAYESMMSMVNKMLTRGDSVQEFDALRRQLDDFAGRGEQQAMMATRLRDVIKNSVNQVEPRYTRDLGRYSRAKDAQAAGKDLADVFPKGSLLGHLAQTAVIGSGIAGMPIVGPGVMAALPMFSPKASGLIANLTGQAVGKTGVRPGAAAPIWGDYQDRRKAERKRNRRSRE